MQSSLPTHPLSRPALQQTLARDLGGWSVSWNPANGGVLSGIGHTPTLEEAPAAFVTRFVEEHAELLGLDTGDLLGLGTRPAGRLEHHFYRQTHAGLPVEGTRLSFSFGPDGGALHFSIRTVPDLVLPSTRPSIALEEARSRAFAGMLLPEAIEWYEGQLVILPSRFSGLAQDHLAWRMRCQTAAPDGAWRMLVDARTGELLERHSLVIGAEQLEGRVEGQIHFPTPWGEELLYGFPNLQVAALLQEVPIDTVFTDDQGYFLFDSLDVGSTSELSLVATLCGPYALIHEHSLSAPPPQVRLDSLSLPATITWDSLSASECARSVFIHTNAAHARLKEIDTHFTELDRPVDVIALDESRSCNAMAYLIPEAPRMVFLTGNETCANTAQIADVVFHEYGHLVTMYAYLPEWPPMVLHEAFSDYFAATIRDTSIIGDGFWGPDTYLRNLENDMTWPVSDRCAEDPHCEGMLLGGALWDMRSALIDQIPDRSEAIALADSLFHYMRYGWPMDFGACLVQLLLQDDDDGDLTNGTPHLEAIAEGFENHNIGDFEVRITHPPLYDTEDTTSARAIEAMIASIYPLDRESVQLHYGFNDSSYVAGVMEGSGWSFQHEIPAQAAGTTVYYYITAMDQSGRAATLPADAPAEVFSYFVGTDETPPVLEHTNPGDPTADQDGIWLWAEITDNIGAIGSARIEATVTQPDSTWADQFDLYLKDPELFPGLYEGFMSLGVLDEGTEIAYHLIARDTSSQENEARFPAEPDSELTLEVRRGRAWDLEAAIPDLNLEGEWEWGVPGSGAAPAHSGSHVIGTVLDGVHSPQLISNLTMNEIDLSEWNAALLEFHTWYNTEEEWDGGQITCSRDQGVTWELLTPAGGYPSWIYNSWGGGHPYALPKLPAFAGESDGWIKVQVPLDDFLEGSLQVRFVYLSDAAVVDLGWYLDDLKIIASQALVPPADLSASIGEDEQVTLSWSEPPGINTTSPAFLGYRIYRTTESGNYPSQPLNADSLNNLTYIDHEVTNGTRYYYAVTSVFRAGESPHALEAMGYPYRPALDVAAQVETSLEGTPVGSDTLTIANSATGELKLDLYHADAEDEWSDLIPQCFLDGASTETFTLLAEDPADTLAPDLKSLSYREWEGNLCFKICLHDSMPNPMEDFTLVLSLDTDLSRATGAVNGNVGADYMVVMGAMIYDMVGTAAIVVTGEGELIGPPSNLILQEGLDSLEVAVRLEDIASPTQVGFAVHTLLPPEQLGAGEPHGLIETKPRDSSTKAGAWDSFARALLGQLQQEQSHGDQLPDEPSSSWLDVSEITAVVTPAAPLELVLNLDFAGFVEEDYAAKIFISSNDPDRPLEAIALTVRLNYTPIEGFTHWSTSSLEDGLLLEWSPADPDSFYGFLLHRWEGEEADEESATQLSGDPITAADDSLYSFLDHSVESARRYYYRLTGLTAGGDSLKISPPAHPLYAPPEPSKLVLEPPWPNPFRSLCAMRLRAPGNKSWDLIIVDVSGRMIRHLIRRGAYGPGIHVVQWDGLDQTGERVAQGMYYAVLREGNRHASRGLVLIR